MAQDEILLGSAEQVSKEVMVMPGGPDDDALEAALGLGDLAGLTINNEADPLSYDVSFHSIVP